MFLDGPVNRGEARDYAGGTGFGADGHFLESTSSRPEVDAGHITPAINTHQTSRLYLQRSKMYSGSVQDLGPEYRKIRDIIDI